MPTSSHIQARRKCFSLVPLKPNIRLSEYFPDGAPAELGQATLEDARKPSVEVLVQAANEVTYTFLFGFVNQLITIYQRRPNKVPSGSIRPQNSLWQAVSQ